jgi:serine/threonine protein kinase
MAQSFLQKLFGGKGLRKYKILHILASGSMSTVYTAESSSYSLVALKISNPNSRKVMDRINRDYRSGKTEGEIAFSFRHPNIVKTYEYGPCAEGEWISMELMRGALLQDRIIEVSRAMRDNDYKVFFATGAALQHIHDKGYVHRDFSPRNIFLLEKGVTKIFDFGLTVQIEMARAKFGNRTGSPSYMAPEVIRRAHTDHRVDIYAFGILLYECLTGRKPTEGRGSLETIMAMLNQGLTPPSQLRDDVSPAIEKVVMKAASKLPDDRYKSMNELLDALEAAGAKGRAEATPSGDMA